MEYRIINRFFRESVVHHDCTTCGENLESTIDEIGTDQNCPECDKIFRVPGQPTEKPYSDEDDIKTLEAKVQTPIGTSCGAGCLVLFVGLAFTMLCAYQFNETFGTRDYEKVESKQWGAYQKAKERGLTNLSDSELHDLAGRTPEKNHPWTAGICFIGFLLTLVLAIHLALKAESRVIRKNEQILRRLKELENEPPSRETT